LDLINFLSICSQQVKFGDKLSSSCLITRSIIQGSSFGPTLYAVMEIDLHPISYYIDLMFKFETDTNLIVPQNTDVLAKADILNIKSWAFENQMEINWDKTNEIVFRRPHNPHLNRELLPVPVCDIEQVLEARLLEVIILENFLLMLLFTPN
jgi:hypothetical protein